MLVMLFRRSFAWQVCDNVLEWEIACIFEVLTFSVAGQPFVCQPWMLPAQAANRQTT